jgi:hypothetical protein
MDTPDKAKTGRPEHEPTAESRQSVKLYAGIGLPHKMIATLLGLGSDNTLRKHYAAELDVGEAEATAKVARCLFLRAVGNDGKGGDLGAMIFWLKARAGWREKHVLDDETVRDSLADMVNASMSPSVRAAVLTLIESGQVTTETRQ